MVEMLTERIRIAVAEAGAGDPVINLGPIDRPSGRGLTLVQTLASGWGCERTDTGKVVWLTAAGVTEALALEGTHPDGSPKATADVESKEYDVLTSEEPQLLARGHGRRRSIAPMARPMYGPAKTLSAWIGRSARADGSR